MRIQAVLGVMSVILTSFLPGVVWAEEVEFGKEYPLSDRVFVFDPSDTYEVMFSLHPHEVDRMSNVRIKGVFEFGKKTFLRFQTLLNNQYKEGLVDLTTVSLIVPTTKSLVSVPELLFDRQPIGPERIKEVRAETVREIMKDDTAK